MKIDPVKYIAQVATAALLEEVSTTPKPGLVDRENSGAHSDMDFFTFINSSASLSPYFLEMARAGYDWEEDLQELFLLLRKIGLQAEKAMFAATNHVNTHKGLIFSLGIISGAAGYFYKQNGTFDVEQILRLCGTMTEEVLENDFEAIKHRPPKTKGEALFLQYGVKGIRGEAISSFASVREVSLPLMQKLFKEGKGPNEVYVQVLLGLMEQVEDTNVLARHNFDTLSKVRQLATRALIKGGIFTESGKRYIEEMDQEFIKERISPGGCADLLAVTIMIYKLMQYQEKKGVLKGHVQVTLALRK